MNVASQPPSSVSMSQYPRKLVPNPGGEIEYRPVVEVGVASLMAAHLCSGRRQRRGASLGRVRGWRTILRHPKQGHTVARAAIKEAAATVRAIKDTVVEAAAAATVKEVESAPGPAGTEVATAAKAP
eukprot:4536071-Prymnesium_polylepis.1